MRFTGGPKLTNLRGFPYLDTYPATNCSVVPTQRRIATLKACGSFDSLLQFACVEKHGETSTMEAEGTRSAALTRRATANSKPGRPNSRRISRKVCGRFSAEGCVCRQAYTGRGEAKHYCPSLPKKTFFSAPILAEAILVKHVPQKFAEGTSWPAARMRKVPRNLE